MKKINKVVTFLLLLTLLFTIYYLLFALLFAPEALAVCPVCTIAVGAGLGLSRFLGIDDSVTGVWAGGLILSTSFWLSDWLTKKFKFNFKYKTLLVVVLMYALVFVPLWTTEIIGHPFNTILGIDKFIFGAIVGSLVFLKTVWLDKKVRQIKGKQLFNYQKVLFPILGLLIASLVLFLITSVKINYPGL